MAATQKKKRRKKGGRKLEFAIYIAGVLAVVLIILGITKLSQAIFTTNSSDESQPDTSSVVSQKEANQPVNKEENKGDEIGSHEESDQSKTDSSSKDQNSSQNSSPSSDNSEKKEDYITYTKSGVAELDEWYLLLVNPVSTIDSDWIADMTYLDSEYRLDSRIIEPYKDMVEAARKDGVTIYPISCYRSYARQQELYKNRVERAKREYPSFTQQQAEDYAATHVARPGTSEHQTGLAIDFNSVETDFGSTKAGKWLKENAEDYGFILRYEEDKQDKTGVTWEPWHYRFVGVKHAKRMNQLGMCLEEYVDYIKAGNQ